MTDFPFPLWELRELIVHRERKLSPYQFAVQLAGHAEPPSLELRLQLAYQGP